MEVKGNISDQSWEIKISSEEIDKLAEYVDKIIPWFIKEGFWMITDQFKYRRGSRILSLMKKWREKVAESWLPLHEIDPKLFLPIIENWSLEKEDSLQDKRANMLANASTGGHILIWYAEILKELWTQEIQVLDRIYDEANLLSKTEWKEFEDIQFSTEKISQNFGIEIKNCKLMMDNFFRLRITEAPALMSMSAWWYHPILKTNMAFQLTTLWVKFIEACKFTS